MNKGNHFKTTSTFYIQNIKKVGRLRRYRLSLEEISLCTVIRTREFVTCAVDIQNIYIFGLSSFSTPYINISKPSDSMVILGNLLAFPIISGFNKNNFDRKFVNNFY